MTLLDVQRLSKRFGAVSAVDNVSFDVARTEMLAIIGPNGAGKSTCFNMIGGQIEPDMGTVLFDGTDITRDTPQKLFRSGIGRTFQIAAVFQSMNVREVLQTALLSRDGRTASFLFPARRYKGEEADELAASVGLQDFLNTECRALSYGDLKRVELALALANRPRLLLMDEPTAGMAPDGRQQMMRLVRSLADKSGISVLFTEHDMDVVFNHADRILVLNKGQVLALDTPDEIRADPAVQAVYLGEEA
ncbi:ABC transporter ATP-binding protein [Hwanghaeella grinnelliae]|uniref:ABC transporter ATP-binding protein n=1 Tax=Hwanghaeella grinnelliae TaxID=2500179 RepID=A0A3S2VRW8_9PROT|nr:ABC transporter ATP-binding protein [Hwanghaeella grinnelliae]RVU38298.1 ABC transporter ATP-binding protein [Hwanghaeella grinnelliae]